MTCSKSDVNRSHFVASWSPIPMTVVQVSGKSDINSSFLSLLKPCILLFLLRGINHEQTASNAVFSLKFALRVLFHKVSRFSVRYTCIFWFNMVFITTIYLWFQELVCFKVILFHIHVQFQDLVSLTATYLQLHDLVCL